MVNKKTDPYSFIPELCVEVIGESVAEGSVIVLPEQGKVKVLNEVGTRIWQLIDGNRSIRDIATQITNEFDVGLKQALIETQNFIFVLQRAGIVINEKKSS